ncbi:MAG: SPOR domain-containing protein [Candidatus Cryptobacteroides sp.]
MKRTAHIIITAVAALTALLISGQRAGAQEMRDSLVYRQAAALDSTLLGRSVFNIISSGKSGEGEVKIHQSQAISSAMQNHINSNRDRKLSGFRVRIFFDNSQNARSTSETTVKRFSLSHPGIPVYRTYQNPFFKVVVGDFRTRSEAMEFLQKIKSEYPGAFVVKENISFPAADRRHTYDVDTVKVQISQEPFRN